MSETVKPGIFDATIIDYGLMKSKSGVPMAMIRFEYTDAEVDTHQVTWFGSFKEGKAAEITTEALAICGMTSNNPADLVKGSGSGVLSDGQQISITLKNEEYEGKVRTKVAYINPLGGGGFRNAMDQAEAAQAFSGMNIAGIMAAARKKHAPKPVKNHAPGADSVDVGF